MKFNIIVILFFVLFITDCARQKTTSSFPIKIQKELDKTNKKFISIMRKNKNEIKNFYIENAILINNNGDCIIGNNQINDYYKNNLKELSSIKSIKTYVRVVAEANVYEIGFYYTKIKSIYSYLTSLRKNGNNWYRELEVLSKNTINNNTNFNKDIDIKRKMISDIINNEHNVKKLVEKVYENKAYYYSRGNLIQGREKIINSLTHMSNLNSIFNLKPETKIQINPDKAYEIGEWNLNQRTGKYILIWRKQSNDDWKIMLDSNY